MTPAQRLLGRLLAASPLLVAGCTPPASPSAANADEVPVPSASGAPATSGPGTSPPTTGSPGASVAAPAGNAAASTTAPPVASAPPVPSATPPVATASAVATVAGVATKKVEFPEEPHCYGGPCAERVRCVQGASAPLPDGLPAPFRGCTTYAEHGTFSKKRSQEQRKKEPGSCCYVELQRPMLGRPLEVASRPRIAALMECAGWS